MQVASCAGADILVLEDGERLSGQVVRVTGGTLVFRTTLSGQMMVPMDTVETLATQGNLVISMRDERIHYGRFARQTGQPQILPLDGSPPRTVDLAQVEEALPIPSPPGSAIG